MSKTKKYLDPELELIWFVDNDIITSSSGEQVGDDDIDDIV